MQYRLSKSSQPGKKEIFLPLSKSINNRLMIMSALSDGKISLKNQSDSDDSLIMNSLVHTDTYVKDAGHAGTVMRFMTAFLAIREGEYFLTGSERMKNRPVEELVSALLKLGADIEYAEKQGYPPLKIIGKKIRGGKIEINSGISSQYISALMMIGPCLEEGLELILTGDTISSSYIDLTIGLMRQAGADVQRKGNRIIIENGMYKEQEMEVEADWSSASYWFSITGLMGGEGFLLPHLMENSLQGDSAITGIFDELGVGSRFTGNGLEIFPTEPKTDFFRFDFRNNPDMVQTFIPYCIAKNIRFELSGCRTLRIKETDRVAALDRELGRFNVKIEYSDDGEYIRWDGKTKPAWDPGIYIETYDDHRMALGLAPLVIPNGELLVNDPGVVSKSYPGFWEDLVIAGFGLEKIW